MVPQVPSLADDRCTAGLRSRALAEALRRDLTAMVRRRVPEREVDDVVQATLVEALASPTPVQEEADPERYRRWVFGIGRHKMIDALRAHRREVLGEPDGTVEVAAESHGEVGELLEWAERELPPGEENRRTLNLMLREGDGEHLESLAEESAIPAATLRQRVSRLRRHFRARWSAQVAALAALGMAVLALGGVWRQLGTRPLLAIKPLPLSEQSWMRSMAEAAERAPSTWSSTATGASTGSPPPPSELGTKSSPPSKRSPMRKAPPRMDPSVRMPPSPSPSSTPRPLKSIPVRSKTKGPPEVDAK